MADPVRTMIRFAKAVEDMNARLDSIEMKLDQLLEYMQPKAVKQIDAKVFRAGVESLSGRGRPKKGQNNG
jgi:hypothetical protein